MRATDLILDLLDTVGLRDVVGQRGAFGSEEGIRNVGAAVMRDGSNDATVPSA
jgi:hypothetical protein